MLPSTVNCLPGEARWYQIIGSTCYDSAGLDLDALLEFFLSLRWDGWQIFLDLSFIFVNLIPMSAAKRADAVISAKVDPCSSFFWSWRSSFFDIFILWQIPGHASPSPLRPCDEYRGRGKYSRVFSVWWRLPSQPPDKVTDWGISHGDANQQASWLTPRIKFGQY